MRDPYRLVGARPEPGFEISVDGAPVPVVPGQTVGAAMHGAGVRSWRTTRFGGRPRGLFCGIGVCFDCLVTINGTPSLRACLTEALPGDLVTTGGPSAPAQGPPEHEAGAGPDERADGDPAAPGAHDPRDLGPSGTERDALGAYAPRDLGPSGTEGDVPGTRTPRDPGVSGTEAPGVSGR